MIIVKIMGGLGNQLQQYALYRRILKEDVPAKLDLSWFGKESQKNMEASRKCELDYFDGLTYEKASEAEIAHLRGGNGIVGKLRRKLGTSGIHILEENKRIYLEADIKDICIDKTVTDMYIDGYFANEYYYSKVLPDLRREIRFPIEKAKRSDDIKKLSSKMKKKDSVSIHIRRGDYLDPINAQGFAGICTKEYYDAAIDYCINHLDNPSFYIFSDDIEYAKEFREQILSDFASGYEDIIVVDINKDEDNFFDMYLMSCCRANIVANSTFSFWGARFNQNPKKIMIRPTIHINNQAFEYEKMKKWWEGWVFVSPQGKVY